MKLLSIGNPKVLKGMSQGYMTYILHLAPADESGYNVCAKATDGCKKGCLNKAGRGGMFKKGETTNVIQKARIRKTKYFFENRDAFMLDLVADIKRSIKQSFKKGLIPVIRLNGTSDLSWEKYLVPGTEMNLFQYFPFLQFYDYTKVLGRKVKAFSNYHLTFSAADGNDVDVARAMFDGYNIAVVFGLKKGSPMPESYLGAPVINGDESDLRFLDPKGVVVGLYAKGPAKKDTTGFVKFVDNGASLLSKIVPVPKFPTFYAKAA
jgi:hypothetical protein